VEGKMQEQVNEQIEVEKHTAEAENIIEGENKTEISLGKFKDVSALLCAYNSLQSEFTKRCQKIKELEGQINKAVDAEVKGDKIINELDREEIVKDYLSKILSSKQKAIVMNNDGGSIKAPIDKPKSIREAGMLAKNILKN
jgi:hypothetical protein